MFIFEIILKSVAYLVNGICTIMYWLLFARIIVSWLPIDPYHSIVQFLIQTTEPILAPLRRLPLRIGMLDLSPFIAFMGIYMINQILVGLLLRMAANFSG